MGNGTRMAGAARPGLLSWALGLLMAVALAGWAGAATAAIYIGTGLTEVKAEDRAKIDHPQPVQLLFVFQTKGAPNAQATKLVKQNVIDTVKASGLFSEVSEAATANGAILSVVIDNVVDPDEMRKAQAKGALTGATFFVAGTNVTDHYVATVDYLPGPNDQKITKSAKQILITQIGMINSAPPDAVKVGNAKAAIAALVTQIVGNPLNEVGKDPAFLGTPAPPPSSLPPVPATPLPDPGATPVAPAATPTTTPTAAAVAPATAPKTAEPAQ